MKTMSRNPWMRNPRPADSSVCSNTVSGTVMVPGNRMCPVGALAGPSGVYAITGATSAFPSAWAMRPARRRTRTLCLPSAMCGPFCSVPPTGTMIVLRQAFVASRTSVHVRSSRKTDFAGDCAAAGTRANARAAARTARAGRMGPAMIARSGPARAIRSGCRSGRDSGAAREGGDAAVDFRYAAECVGHECVHLLDEREVMSIQLQRNAGLREVVRERADVLGIAQLSRTAIDGQSPDLLRQPIAHVITHQLDDIVFRCRRSKPFRCDGAHVYCRCGFILSWLPGEFSAGRKRFRV